MYHRLVAMFESKNLDYYLVAALKSDVLWSCMYVSYIIILCYKLVAAL